MANEAQQASLASTRAFFEKTIACFEPRDGTFRPQEGLFTVAQHIAHSAQVVEWFLEGAFRPKGMSADFAAMEAEVRAVEGLEDARRWWQSALDEALESVAQTAPEAWNEPIQGQILRGLPRHAIFSAIADHSAHHRGALAVYARLAGRTPQMPYE